jgi:antitoxin component YwqK of YwqJK toxin-antitoxin module
MRSFLLSAMLVMANCLSAQEIISQERWPDGSLRATRYSEGERIHFITYHENGKVKEIGAFRNGRRDGAWKQYSDTGALLAQAGFRNGQRQGVWEFRDAEDKTTGRLIYAAGILEQAEQYDDAGALVAQRMY